MVSRLNYRGMVPDDSFIAQYMDAQSESETPSAYDFWCACWLLSVALGRGIRVERPRAPVYLNNYCILVAESGVTRKSTAVRQAAEIARQFTRASAPEMFLVQSNVTAHRMMLRMNDLTDHHGTSQVLITAEELVTLLGKHNYTMPGFLTDMYDCPSNRVGGMRFDQDGNIVNINVRDVYVSLLGASTPTWLRSAISPAIIEGGFTSRCLFVVAEDRKRRIAWPSDSTPGVRTSTSFATDLGRIRNDVARVKKIAGGIPVSDGGRREFESWYQHRDEHRDPFRASFEAREDHHILRLAAYLAVSDGRWEIQHDHITKAKRIVGCVKEDAAALFAHQSPVGKAAQGIERVFDRLKEAGRSGLSQAQISSYVARFIDAQRLNIVLAIMAENLYVQKFLIHESKYGKPLTLWRITKNAQQRGARAHVLRDFERVIEGAEARPSLRSVGYDRASDT